MRFARLAIIWLGRKFARGAGCASSRQNFSEVKGLAIGQLGNLLTATEPIGDENRGWAGGFDGREKALIGDSFRDLKFASFEAKWAGHSAATGLDELDIGSGLAKQRDFAGRAAEDGFVMAVAVNENLSVRERAGGKFRHAIGELAGIGEPVGIGKPVGEEKDLLAETLGAGIVGEQFRQLIFEDAGATGLKKDERNPRLNLRRHAVENAREIGPGGVKKTEVVERAAAADVSAGNLDLKSCRDENSLRGRERLRMIVVVPGVGPQQDHLRWGRLLDEICGG